MDLTAVFQQHPTAKVFAAHGVDFTGARGDELIGSCPFTGKGDKFFVNTKSWLWDSKTAGLSGNVSKFLKEIQQIYIDAVDEDQLLELAQDRKLPRAALRPWGIGWNGRAFTFPVQDINHHMVDIRTYSLRNHVMKSTAGCKVGLLGSQVLNERLSEPIYLCEGEWDAVAMAWLLIKNRAPGVVLAVPGAGVFKQEWAQWFSGRRVHALYDHDAAGRHGEEIMAKRIGSIAKQLTYTHWPEDLPEGFDLRDWVTYGLKKKTPDLSFERLQFLFKKKPRSEQPERRSQPRTGDGKIIRLIPQQKVVADAPTLDAVHGVFTKWLSNPNLDAVDIVLASILSMRMDGPPVWMFLVGPPGSAKTMTLETLAECDNIFSTSSLTSHSLISGANWQGQQDPSLIPKLHDKTLVIKDFTAVLGMREMDKEEIFSILRDAYDGKCGKIFGNGVERSYVSRFGILAAVTPAIYELGHQHQALGERFLKYTMSDNLHHASEDEIISRAIDNVDRDSKMKEELAAVGRDFIANSRADYPVPDLDNTLHKKIVALARLGARLRGTVTRNSFQNEVMTGRPFAEIGSRLGIQLAKLARALALVRGKPSVTEDEYRLVKQVVLDTVSQRNEDIIRAILRICPAPDDYVSTINLAEATRYPQTTIRRVLDDMHLLDAVSRKGSGWKYSWSLSPYIRKCIKDSELYTTDPELGRKAHVVFRVRRSRAPISAVGTGA